MGQSFNVGSMKHAIAGYSRWSLGIAPRQDNHCVAAVGVMAGAITGEFLGGGKGFGELIRDAASQLNTPRVFSLILYLSLLGLALFVSGVWIQRRFVFWHKDRVIASEDG